MISTAPYTIDKYKLESGNFESNRLFLQKNMIHLQGKKVLELGSGSGNMVKYLTEQGIKINGSDVDENFINFAKDKYQLELSQLDAQKINLPDNSFDTIISFDVFEHLADSDAHLIEVKRILTKGGYYLLQTPNKWLNIPFEIIKKKSFSRYKNYHVSLHNYWQLKQRFERHGFSVEFQDIPVVNTYFTMKVERFLGVFGRMLLKIINPDCFPIFLRTNFYLVAKVNK